MIDWERVAELRDEIGPEDFVEVVELFMAEVEDTLTHLRKDLKNLQKMRNHMHFLKGSALNLGFSRLSDLCSHGENSADAGRLAISVDEVCTLYWASRRQFEKEIQVRFAA